ncbi:MAG: PilN domain-containing protein [Nitrospirota bacterium]|nr:PilN domain-containing protein [Nitrospirota bacterium]
MIHINLLPQKRGRVSKKTVEVRNFIAITVAAVVATMIVGFVATGVLLANASTLESHNDEMNAQIDKLKNDSKQIANFEENKARFEEKIAVIRRLRKHQTRPVRFLDALAHHMPNQVWLTEIEESEDTKTKKEIVEITGMALSNTDIVEMLRELKQLDLISGVQLKESKRSSREGMSAFEFTIRAVIVTGEPVAAPAGSKIP